MNGHVRCLQRLLELGVDRDPRDAEGMMPLHLAAHAGRVECVNALLDAGADVCAATMLVSSSFPASAFGAIVQPDDVGAAGLESRPHCRRGS